MKNILKVFGILCSMGVNISCHPVEKRIDNAFEHCLKEFNVTVDEFVSTDVDLTCFNTCVARQAEIIKDKKFYLEKYIEYLVAIAEAENSKEVVEAYEYCMEEMLDFEDECDSYVKLEKCVDKKLKENYKKD
ncbi:uncharacterized protein LOC117168520 [Belonocnema kinseyi]|uniref:uncharacterized protein LOC117168520 n=1 Tax=Belonocnema kinseyi TaxID=2817044 RepID=UPI00143CDE09|nr:uncharacterized protein LOC117168520 [Belonocnema kinseyi]